MREAIQWDMENFMRKVRLAIIASVALMGGVGCQEDGPGHGYPVMTTPPPRSDAHYFVSPEVAVPAINGMVREKDWSGLSAYYDAAGSAEADSKPPFLTGSRFISTEPTAEPSIVEVTVELDIPQGGGMVQKGMGTFRMTHTMAGYQIHREAAASSAEGNDDAKMIVAYRPEMAAKIDTVPMGSVKSLPRLLDMLADWNHRAQIAPMGAMMAVDATGQKHYVASSEELMQSLIGKRILAVLDTSSPAVVVATLTAAGYTEESFHYVEVTLHRVNVAGTGPVIYVDEPVAKTAMLPKKDTGF